MLREGFTQFRDTFWSGGEGGRTAEGGLLHQGRAVETKLSKSDKSFLLEHFPPSPICHEAGVRCQGLSEQSGGCLAPLHLPPSCQADGPPVSHIILSPPSLAVSRSFLPPSPRLSPIQAPGEGEPVVIVLPAGEEDSACHFFHGERGVSLDNSRMKDLGRLLLWDMLVRLPGQN